MKIKESKNLRYDKIPRLTDSFDEYNAFEPRFCMLAGFNRIANKLELCFRNGSRAFITARNNDGRAEINAIIERLNDFIDKSYEEILNTDF